MGAQRGTYYGVAAGSHLGTFPQIEAISLGKAWESELCISRNGGWELDAAGASGVGQLIKPVTFPLSLCRAVPLNFTHSPRKSSGRESESRALAVHHFLRIEVHAQP